MSNFEIGDSYYAALAVPPSASANEIKKAWVEQTHRFHADITGDTDHFKYLLDAGEVLRDDEKRQAYDALGHDLFIQRYGRRGEARPIDPADLNPSTANTITGAGTGQRSAGGTGAASGATASAGAGTTASAGTRASTTASAGTGTTAGTRGSTTANSGTGTTASNRAHGGARSQRTNDAGTAGTGRTDGGYRGHTASRKSSDRNASGVRDSGWRVFGKPLVAYPVTMRCLGLVLAVITTWSLTGGSPHAGSGLDLILMVAFAAVALAAVDAVPSGVTDATPRHSRALSRIGILPVAAGLVVATTIAALGDFTGVYMVAYAAVIWLPTGAAIGVVALFGGVLGLCLAILRGVLAAFQNGSHPGSVTRSVARTYATWGLALGVGMSLLSLLTPVRTPSKAVLQGILEISVYPWPFVHALPVSGLNLPLIATYVLSFLLVAGVVGGFPLGILLLLHEPRRRAERGGNITPVVWELAAAIPPITLCWWLLYGDHAHQSAFFVRYATRYQVTAHGIVEFVWLPLLAVVLLFTARAAIESRHSS